TNIGDQDIIQILSGFTSTVAGIGALRTHKSSAHGHGRNSYCLEGRHARLAINAAHTLALFILEAWAQRRGPS
ncbi:MAG: ATP-dependent RNA helicase HrpA, partial [Acidobacteria bacterium]